MINVIQNRIIDFGLTASGAIIDFLHAEIGNNVFLLERALEKIALTCENKIITKEIIQNQVSSFVFHNSFELAYALVLKDKVRAIKISAELKKYQENPINLIGAIAWQFRIVLKIRLHIDDGFNKYNIGSRYSLFGTKLDILLHAAQSVDVKLQLQRLHYLMTLDRQLKTSYISPWLFFDAAIIKLCNQY